MDTEVAPSSPFGIKGVMTKNRFEELSCCLHFNDSTKHPASGDRDFKVCTKLEMFLITFSVNARRISCKGKMLL